MIRPDSHASPPQTRSALRPPEPDPLFLLLLLFISPGLRLNFKQQISRSKSPLFAFLPPGAAEERFRSRDVKLRAAGLRHASRGEELQRADGREMFVRMDMKTIPTRAEPRSDLIPAD